MMYMFMPHCVDSFTRCRVFILMYRYLKNFPYHMGDSVEIKKIQTR